MQNFRGGGGIIHSLPRRRVQDSNASAEAASGKTRSHKGSHNRAGETENTSPDDAVIRNGFSEGR